MAKNNIKYISHKKKNQAIHTQKRALERFNIEISKNDIAIMIEQIKSGKSEPVKKVSNRVTKHIVVIRDKRMLVIYDKIRKSIATCMPEDWK
jgi:energy-coupling factor transporter ATP-binding protein EcfA2